MSSLTRREFISLAAAGVAATRTTLLPQTPVQPGGITAQQVVDRIRKNIGVEWRTDTVDTFKAGDPATVVRGIATTALPTIEALRRVVAAGANLVITCEPTFYSRADNPSPPGARGGGPVAPDPVFAAKNEFIKANGLIIWRFSDHWRQRRPDPFAVGLGEALGWSKLEPSDEGTRVTIPAIALDSLASEMRKKLGARGGIRVVGDPKLSVARVGLLPGTTAIQAALRLLPTVDAVVAGEVREWESVEYARDKVAAGEKRSLILVGRVVSENAGMDGCARWLRTIVPELKTTWIPIADPYWRPA
jgi:hypothetical protein